MFSNTAYEALYEYLGLSLHSKFIEIITSQRIFLASLTLIFGVAFFGTTVRFFSRYLPNTLVRRHPVALSKYFQIVFSLFIGISILKVDTNTSVKRFNGESWHENTYLRQKITDIQPEYRVSFVFDVLSRTAEEFSAFLARTVDHLFQSTNSQLDAPDFFYKAILYAGTTTIDNEELVNGIDFYVSECFDRVLPLVGEWDRKSALDRFFSGADSMDEKLSDLSVSMADGTSTTCLDLKNQVGTGLIDYARVKGQDLTALSSTYLRAGPVHAPELEHLYASEYLVNHFYEDQEGFLGIQKGSQPPSGSARIFQYLGRFFSWDGLVALVSGGSTSGQGAALAAKRAQEFSQNLTRAPHVAGAIKMVLIFIFPWLVFVIVAGRWKVLFYWFFAYFSVLLWAPIWTLFYHIMVNISLSAEQLQAFGKLSDGLSLYSAELITHRMNYMFAVFSWIQLLIGVLLSGSILFMIRPMFSDHDNDHAPEFVQDSGKALAAGSKAIGMVG